MYRYFAVLALARVLIWITVFWEWTAVKIGKNKLTFPCQLKEQNKLRNTGNVFRSKDCAESEVSIGFVLKILWGTKISLDGDGGFRLAPILYKAKIIFYCMYLYVTVSIPVI
jgi:hypothetical protein